MIDLLRLGELLHQRNSLPDGTFKSGFGADGSVVSDHGGICMIAAPPVEAKDATGPRDCFDVIFLDNHLSDGDILKAAEAANRGVALSTMGYGAVAPIPY